MMCFFWGVFFGDLSQRRRHSTLSLSLSAAATELYSLSVYLSLSLSAWRWQSTLFLSLPPKAKYPTLARDDSDGRVDDGAIVREVVSDSTRFW